MSANITEQAAQVLREIDAAIAQWEEEVTPGPWQKSKTCIGIPAVMEGCQSVALMGIRQSGRVDFDLPNCESNATFIAASRTLLPAFLQIIRDDIKAWLELRDSLQVGRDDVTTWDFCQRRLTAILDAWEDAK